jgi:hypothetical protein
VQDRLGELKTERGLPVIRGKRFSEKSIQLQRKELLVEERK